MTAETVSLWAAIPAAILLVVGGLLALIGGLGLLRLRNFYQRLHAPTLSNTLGCTCVLVASLLYFSALRGRLVFHEFLITLFIALTAPVAAMLLIKVGMYRERRTQRASGSEEPDMPGEPRKQAPASPGPEESL